MTTKPAVLEKQVDTLSSTFRDWDSASRSQVLQRTQEARGLVIATLARAHHLQLGPPGTAKSYLVTTALGLIEGAKTMKVQLHGYSQMEDMYGPISLKALKEDRYYRITDTYVPWADFVFADEVFKANPTLLQANLWAFNERIFRNDGEIGSIPLISAFFASNEGPEDPTLQAFDDRIHLRYNVSPIREASTRLAMFKARLSQVKEPRPVLSIEDIRKSHELVDAVEIPDFVLGALNELAEELARVQIVPTDRKFNDALRLIQAAAFFKGRSTATVDDMSILAHMFWSNPKDIPVVASKVGDLANPLDKKALGLRRELEVLAEEVEEIIAIEAKAVRIRRSVDTHDKLEEANAELIELRTQAKNEGIQSDIIEETRQRLHSVTERLLSKGFRYNKNASQLDQEELLRMIQETRESKETDK
jgi:MoxR-like ATPase